MDAVYVGLGMCAIGALLWVRNELAYAWGQKAIEEAHQLNLKAIDEGRYGEVDYYALIPSYFGRMFDLTQWRYVSPFKA